MARRLDKVIMAHSMCAECGQIIEAPPCGTSLHLLTVFVVVSGLLIHR